MHDASYAEAVAAAMARRRAEPDPHAHHRAALRRSMRRSLAVRTPWAHLSQRLTRALRRLTPRPADVALTTPPLYAVAHIPRQRTVDSQNTRSPDRAG